MNSFNPELKAKSDTLAILDAIIRIALATPRPMDPFWNSQPSSVVPIQFALLEEATIPLAFQRRVLEELFRASVISIFGYEGGPHSLDFNSVSTYEFPVYLDRAYKYRDELAKQLQKLPAGDGLSRNALPAPDKPTLPQQLSQEEINNSFGPLRIDSDGNVRCFNRRLDMPDRYKLILRFLIRYPTFHKFSDIAKELYPTGTHYTDKTVHVTIQKYVSDINKILLVQTDEVKIKLAKYDLAESGYQIVSVPKKKPPSKSRKAAK